MGIKEGLTNEDRIDEALIRSMRQLFWAGLFDPVEKVSWTSIPKEAINSTEHQAINYDAALQSFVLLENNGILPLKPGRKIAVVGPQANGRGSLLSDYAGDQQCADGSDKCIISIFDAVQKENGESSLTSLSSGISITGSETKDISAALAAC